MNGAAEMIAACAVLVGVAGWAVDVAEGRVTTRRDASTAAVKPAIDLGEHAKTERAVFALG